MLSLGVIGSSRKADEKRVPLHPKHFDRLGANVRANMLVERGYGLPFGVSDQDLLSLGVRLESRQDVMRTADVILLFKPVVSDLHEMHAGQTLWGCPHFTLDTEFTGVAIQQKISSITIEGMRHHTPGGGFSLFVFHRVCEVAGYASVRHAMQLRGKSGAFGRRLKACVVGYGSTGRGAVAALKADDVSDISVLTERPTHEVSGPPSGVLMSQYHRDENGGLVMEEGSDVASYLKRFDIVVNCVLQSPLHPKVFLHEHDLDEMPDALLVDVSCDTHMGFSWATPTTFSQPLIKIGPAWYYAVDHSPSLYWDSASEVISEALVPYVEEVLGGRKAWRNNVTIEGALEMDAGQLLNKVAIAYQGRADAYPHQLVDATEKADVEAVEA